MTVLRLSSGVAAVILATACRRAGPPDSRIVGEWTHGLYGAIRAERMSPPVASRIMAYATTALYGGFAAADPALPPLGGTMNGLADLPLAAGGEADGALVAIEAERTVLDSLLHDALPTTRSAMQRLADSLAAARSATGVPERVRTRSAQLGRSIGLAVVAWSRTDGFDSTRTHAAYSPPKGPGLWFNDAPSFTYTTQNLSGASELVVPGNPANQLRAGNSSDRGLILSRPKLSSKTLPSANVAGITEPYWSELRPFVLTKWDECAIPLPPPYATDRASEMRKDAAFVFETQRGLTSEQRAIALFWADNAGESGTPVGHWLSIVGQLASERRIGAAAASRILHLTAIAQADAFIAIWGYKFRFNVIRPRTYIRRALDPLWEPLIPTPPFPEYPSGHSGQSAAAATVLTALMGAQPFDDSTSVSLGHPVRRFASFVAASDEAGMSRIYAGIHYPFGNLAGRALGQCVGDRVLRKFRIKLPR